MDFEFDNDELAELQLVFFEQATEVIDSLGGLILNVEKNPSDTESLRSIRRAVHTLKGDSTAFGFSELTELAHKYEDALDRLHASEQAASRELIDLILSGADTLAALITFYKGEGTKPDYTSLIEGLASLNSSNETQNSQLSEIVNVTTNNLVADAVESDLKASMDIDEPSAIESESTKMEEPSLPVSLSIPTSDQETIPTSESINSVPAVKNLEDKRPVEVNQQSLNQGQTVERKASPSMTLRVESERVDTAMNLVGELIIQRSMLSTLISILEDEKRNDDLGQRLSEALALSGRTLSELQESVMRMRLVPIDQVFRRFPRVVRDASIKLNKPLRLDIIGGQTEIDKSVVEVISDPLIHLVRNACDHGIESPERRRAAGKAEEGVILLRARRAGNQIAVDVEDDGAGIDPTRVVEKAIKKGVISAQDVIDWTDQQKIGLIFLPGFSTVDQVSDMSGRGVGMDVVKTTVDSLGGSVTVSSVIGQGTRFTIKLPLTMAIVRAMLFESCNRRFALPLDTIREITRLRPEELKTIDGREVIRLRDRVLPLIRVDEVLGLRDRSKRIVNTRVFVFIVELGDGRDVGLAVEALHGEQELVLKTVDDALCKSAMVAGASILGDGEVVLILDPGEIVNEAAKFIMV